MIRHIYQHAERFDRFFNRLAATLLLAFHLLFTFSNGWATKKDKFCHHVSFTHIFASGQQTCSFFLIPVIKN